ncbi:unnamed protein product [Boreogadus saida]
MFGPLGTQQRVHFRQRPWRHAEPISVPCRAALGGAARQRTKLSCFEVHLYQWSNKSKPAQATTEGFSQHEGGNNGAACLNGKEEQ